MVEGNACNCSCPMWKPTYHATVTKVLQITSWVPMCLLPWAQDKKWIPIGLMGCVHTHLGMPIIEGSPRHIQNVVLKSGEDNWKVEKIGQVVSQTFTPRPKHDEIWAWWALDVSLKSMLEKVWWCRCFEMEPWNWTICCPMSYSNGGRHARVGGGRRSHATLRCCWKRNVLLSIGVKASKRKGHW